MNRIPVPTSGVATPLNSQWQARVVVAIQLGVWCAVGALLLHMGLSSLQARSGGILVEPPNSTVMADNSTVAAPPTYQMGPQRSIKPSAVLMVAVGGLMLAVGPFVLIYREFDVRRHHRRFSKVDLPPSYEEVAGSAPRYSMLFDVTESGECIPITPNNRQGDQCALEDGTGEAD